MQHRTLTALTLVGAAFTFTPNATAQFIVPKPFPPPPIFSVILNQSNMCQDAWYQIYKNLPANKAVAEIKFDNASGSIKTYGLWSHGDGPLVDRGEQNAVFGEVSIASPAPQEGDANGSLGFADAYFAGGNFIGAKGVGRALTLDNLVATAVSTALGGSFQGGSTTGDTLNLDGVGGYFVGGVRGELIGRVDNDPGTGAVAGVIGIDSADPNSTSPHYGGYFDGNVRVYRADNIGASIEVANGTGSSTGLLQAAVASCDGCYSGFAKVNDVVIRNLGTNPNRKMIFSTAAVTAPNIKFSFVSASREILEIRDSGGLNTDCNLTLLAGDAAKPAGGMWAMKSDRRLKKEIYPLKGALDKLLELKGVTFEYKDPELQGVEGEQIGFIAQEVQDVFPQWVGEGSDGYKTVSVKGLAPLTVEALRELSAEKDAEVAELQGRIARLEGLVERLAEDR